MTRQTTVLEQLSKEDILSSILRKLLQACNERDVEEVIKDLDAMGSDWRLVGDRSNYATIHVTANPGATIVERVTNAIDARLELAAQSRQDLASASSSPRAFTERVFGVKEGYLTSIDGRKEREDLVEDAGIVVRLRDSDSTATPTIDIQDLAIGMSREEFPDTILSLNQNNKIKKWYLMGRFGQGGSATLRFSKYTIIVSRRRISSGKADDSVSFTIVRLRDAEKDEKDGQYVYLVNKHDRLPFSAKVDEATFPPGTLVRHIDYEIGGGEPPSSLGHLQHFGVSAF